MAAAAAYVLKRCCSKNIRKCFSTRIPLLHLQVWRLLLLLRAQVLLFRRCPDVLAPYK
jgi:hypothetical protein